MLKKIGATFPNQWLWGRYESEIIRNVADQIHAKWPDDRNLLVNLTWFGPSFSNGYWQQVCEIIDRGEPFDHTIFLSSVDPLFISPDTVAWLNDRLPSAEIYWAGNYPGRYEFNFFAIVGKHLFKRYDNHEVLMRDPKYLFLNYNRKPRQHRVDFVKKILASGHSKLGLFTLGKDTSGVYSTPNDLYFSLGEDQDTYRDCMHAEDGFGIPDDVLSLHNIHYWQHHFLNIIGATEFWPWDPVFVTESQWKPMIGLRPFVINGNTNTYKWLENNGFRTFNQYWPVDLEVNEEAVHDSILQVLDYLTTQDLRSLYQKMLPDLLHNKKRFYEFADEQEHKLNHLFDGD